MPSSFPGILNCWNLFSCLHKLCILDCDTPIFTPFFIIVLVILSVSGQYSSTDLTLELNIQAMMPMLLRPKRTTGYSYTVTYWTSHQEWLTRMVWCWLCHQLSCIIHQIMNKPSENKWKIIKSAEVKRGCSSWWNHVMWKTHEQGSCRLRWVQWKTHEQGSHRLKWVLWKTHDKNYKREQHKDNSEADSFVLWQRSISLQVQAYIVLPLPSIHYTMSIITVCMNSVAPTWTEMNPVALTRSQLCRP